MTKNVFEGSVLNLTGKITGGDKEAKKQAKFVFKQEGGASKIADASVQLKNDVASHKVTLPKIKDDEASYAFSYSIEAGGETHDGDVDYKVFPKKIELEAVDKDSKAFPNVEFKLIQGTAEKKLHFDKSAKASLQLKDADEFKIDAIAPFILDNWVAETGHKRKAQFSRTPYKVAFHSHKPGTLKQYVNLPAKGGDDQGNLITVKVGAEGDDTADPANRLAKKDDPIFVKVEFDKDNSKRKDPKPSAQGFKASADGRTYTKKLLIPKDGEPAVFKVQLGYAGGDKCTISIGTNDKYEEGELEIENARKLYYQLTVPKGTNKPDMTRMIDALKEVGVEYEEYKKIEVDETDGPNLSWFPGEWLGEAGKKFLNIGDHNKGKFHAKFDDQKSPIGVHVLCCHTQFDCLGPSTVKKFAKRVLDGTKQTLWSDGNHYPGTMYSVGRGLFPKKMKDGTNTVISGSWKEVGGKASGSITEADLWVDHVNWEGWAFIKLPAAAAAVVAGGKNISLNMSFYCALGPFLGESDGSKGWLQLIVVKQKEQVVNDVLAHELGHTMGQVTKVVPGGLKGSDHGRRYDANGHQGPHCADGMSDDDYAKGKGKKGTAYEGDFRGKPECTCIMYGENGEGSTCVGKYCARCQPFIKAQALTSLHGGGKAGEKFHEAGAAADAPEGGESASGDSDAGEASESVSGESSDGSSSESADNQGSESTNSESEGGGGSESAGDATE